MSQDPEITFHHRTIILWVTTKQTIVVGLSPAVPSVTVYQNETVFINTNNLEFKDNMIQMIASFNIVLFIVTICLLILLPGDLHVFDLLNN